jgi:hypothetical protein
MAYDPLTYAQTRAQNRSQTAQQVTGYIGQGLGAMGGLADALQEASKNWRVMEDTYKVMKSTYAQHAQPLVDAQMMSEEDLQRNMSRFPQPDKQLYSKNPQSYIDKMQQATQMLFKDLDDKTTQMKQGQRTEAAAAQTKAMFGGQPSQPLPQQGPQPLPQQGMPQGQSPVTLPPNIGTPEFEAAPTPQGPEVPQQPIAQPVQPEQPVQALPQGPGPQSMPTQAEAYFGLDQSKIPHGGGMSAEEFKQAGGGFLPTEKDIAARDDRRAKDERLAAERQEKLDFNKQKQAALEKYRAARLSQGKTQKEVDIGTKNLGKIWDLEKTAQIESSKIDSQIRQYTIDLKRIDDDENKARQKAKDDLVEYIPQYPEARAQIQMAISDLETSKRDIKRQLNDLQKAKAAVLSNPTAKLTEIFGDVYGDWDMVPEELPQQGAGLEASDVRAIPRQPESRYASSDIVRRRLFDLRGATGTGKVTPQDIENWRPIITSAAEKHGLDPDLLAALIEQESAGDPKAVSTAGAGGLAQLMPGTAKDVGVSDRFNPEQSVMGGAQYLAQMLEKYGDVQTALQAYNAGPGKVDKVLRGEDQFAKETQEYVPAVLKRYQRISSGKKSAASGAQPQSVAQPQSGALPTMDTVQGAITPTEKRQGLTPPDTKTMTPKQQELWKRYMGLVDSKKVTMESAIARFNTMKDKVQ